MTDPGKRYDEEEIAQLREQAWHEQGIVIVSITDPRLLHSERSQLITLAEKLYEHGGVR